MNLPALSPNAWPIVAAALAALWLLALVGWWRARTRVARGNRGRQRIARRAERRAERLLAKHGFTLVERQPLRRWSMAVDGEAGEVSCRADLLVMRDGQRYVADVKTGGMAPRPRHPATRRQLLEYLLVFEADGALLVDMRRREVRLVAFPGLLDR